MRYADWLRCGVVMAAALATPAAAETTQDPRSQQDVSTVEDIIVTAQRREERLQEVPLAVSAFNVEALADSKVESLLNLDGRVPNVVLAPVGAYPFASAFYIRGLGFADVESSYEPSVGVEIDGVYMTRNSGAIQDFFDIGSVSILRGPQGTLYGRNTIGGVISIQSKRPSFDFGARGQLTFGANGRQELRAAIEGPLVEDKLAGKISLLAKNYDGYIRNDDGRNFGEQEVRSLRGSLLWTPTDTFDATLIIDHTEENGNGTAFQNASLPTMLAPQYGVNADTDGDPYLSHVGDDQVLEVNSSGLALNANWNLGPVTLTSITGFRKSDNYILSDYDGTHIPFMTVVREEDHEQFSQEFRLASNAEGPLKYVLGAYYMNQEYNIFIDQYGLALGGTPANPKIGPKMWVGQEASSWALFGQADYSLTDKLTLTAGGRYSKEEKTFWTQPGGFNESRTFEASFDDFSPKFGISYKVNDAVMTYAQYSRGFRAGGFNGRAGSFTAVGPYDSETAESYEIGLKADLFNRRLRLNSAIFTTEYSDMQQSVQGLIPGTTLNQTLISNVGQATISGFESEITALVTDHFTLTGTIGYLDAGLDSFVADLNDGLGLHDRSYLPMTFSPKWSNSITGTHKQDFDWGRLSVQASARYMSEIRTSFTPINAYSDLTTRQGNTIVDGSIAVETPDGRWRASLWGKNLTDEVVINNTMTVGQLIGLRVYQPPREVGIDVSFTF